jgi:hypothetical protein
MILAVYTIIHTLISLAGIFTGFIVLFGLLAGKRLAGWTKWFLITNVATSVTGFFFPFHGFTPAYPVGVICLIALGLAIFARYRRQLTGPWRWIYVVGTMIAFYFNVFVGVVMAFRRVPALHAMAPTQTEPPFQMTQLVVLALFIVLTIIALIRFRPEPFGAT